MDLPVRNQPSTHSGPPLILPVAGAAAELRVTECKCPGLGAATDIYRHGIAVLRRRKII